MLHFSKVTKYHGGQLLFADNYFEAAGLRIPTLAPDIRAALAGWLPPEAGTALSDRLESLERDVADRKDLRDPPLVPRFPAGLHDYDDLFAEKLGLLLQLRDAERVTWKGRHRAPLDGRGVYPRPLQNPLPVWIAVGGTPESVVRAATLGLPLALAIIGGMPERFVPLVDLYRDAARRAGHDPATLPVSINAHGYLADTSQQAADEAANTYGGCGPRLNEEVDASEWLGKENGPAAKLENEKEQGETIAYDELVKRWTENQ